LIWENEWRTVIKISSDSVYLTTHILNDLGEEIPFRFDGQIIDTIYGDDSDKDLFVLVLQNDSGYTTALPARYINDTIMFFDFGTVLYLEEMNKFKGYNSLESWIDTTWKTHRHTLFSMATKGLLHITSPMNDRFRFRLKKTVPNSLINKNKAE